MQKPIVTKTLKSKLETLGMFPLINAGGCGIVAYALKKLKPDLQIYATSRGDRDNDFITVYHDYFNNGLPSPEEFCYTAVHFIAYDKTQRLYFHAGGTYTKENQEISGKPILLYEFTPEILLHMIKYGSWNDMFNRDRGVPFIENTLNVSLKEVW